MFTCIVINFIILALNFSYGIITGANGKKSSFLSVCTTTLQVLQTKAAISWLCGESIAGREAALNSNGKAHANLSNLIVKFFKKVLSKYC